MEACRSGKVLQARAKDDFQAPLKQPLLLRVAVRAGDFALQAASRYRSELNDTTSTLCGNLWTEQSVSVRSHVCWRFRHAINRMELNYLVETLSHAYSACQDASGCGRGRLVRFLRPDFQPLKELGAASLAFSVRARTLAAIYIFIKPSKRAIAARPNSLCTAAPQKQEEPPPLPSGLLHSCFRAKFSHVSHCVCVADMRSNLAKSCRGHRMADNKKDMTRR